jgi:hypothetical protein
VVQCNVSGAGPESWFLPGGSLPRPVVGRKRLSNRSVDGRSQTSHHPARTVIRKVDAVWAQKWGPSAGLIPLHNRRKHHRSRLPSQTPVGLAARPMCGRRHRSARCVLILAPAGSLSETTNTRGTQFAMGVG